MTKSFQKKNNYLLDSITKPICKGDLLIITKKYIYNQAESKWMMLNQPKLIAAFLCILYCNCSPIWEDSKITPHTGRTLYPQIIEIKERRYRLNPAFSKCKPPLHKAKAYGQSKQEVKLATCIKPEIIGCKTKSVGFSCYLLK